MTLKIPALPNPFSFAIHPSFMPENPTPYVELDIYDSHPFEKATRDYTDHFELFDSENQRQRLWNLHCGWLGALMYPVGGEELLQVGIDFCTWAFAYDDEYCDEGELSRNPSKFIQASAEMWRQMESPEHKLSNDRYALALRDIRIRMDKYATPEQTERFLRSMCVYLMAEMWKSIEPRPSLNDYISMRVTGGGAWSFPTLGHIIANVQIHQNYFEDRRVRAIFEMLSHLMAWETDPHAYLKELTRGSNYKEHNLIRVLMRERQYDIEDAINEYLDMRIKILSLVLRIKEQVEKEAIPGVSEFIESIIRYYVGATIWSQNTRRYKSMSGFADESAFVGGELTPPILNPQKYFNDTKPIEIDAIKWWWSYDPLKKEQSA